MGKSKEDLIKQIKEHVVKQDPNAIKENRKKIEQYAEQEDKPFVGIAEKYFQHKTGRLHLEWLVNEYWGMVAKEKIVPKCQEIYQILKDGNHTKESPVWYGDADGYTFYIPHDTKKVWAHINQCGTRSYLQIESKSNFKIRRIYDVVESEDDCRFFKEIVDFKSAVKYSSRLEDLADDDYECSYKHSLDWYIKNNFKIESFVCDGYVMDYNKRSEVVEHAMTSHQDLDVISDVYLDVILESLTNA